MSIRVGWRRLAPLLLIGCAATGPVLRWAPPARGPRTSRAVGSAGVAYDRDIAGRFDRVRVEAGDLTYPQLAARLELARAPEAGPSFDPTGARYWRDVRKALQLTAEEQAIFRRTALVGVDVAHPLTMAQAYGEIYRHDLPVLITTDSILHALHRSFDRILAEMESEQFAPVFTEVLKASHEALRQGAPALRDPRLRRSAQDVDLYLTVARKLLAGPDDEPQIAGVFEQAGDVHDVLAAIATLAPNGGPELYGRSGDVVDWSQFAPRGHYTKAPALTRYFQTLMWLGRVDTGFVLSDPDPAFGRHAAAREATDAALLAWVLRESQGLDKLEGVDRAVSFLVGLSDNVTPRELVDAMDRAGVRQIADLSNGALLDAAIADLARRGTGAQRTRSQVGDRGPDITGPERPLPRVFQLFGQRFVIDSFVLSKVVFDAIEYQHERPSRQMPSGLDVAAALGNDESVALLEPELTRWGYGANLLAARRVTEERPADAWNATVYDLWLSALSKLDDVPAGAFPQVMQGRAWQRKQLETQLASWAELRHDTILYAKQSYTMKLGCQYPAGYVEPYPAFYARLALLAEEATERLQAVGTGSPRAIAYLTEFGSVVRRLEALARTELAGQPFSENDETFIKQTIHVETHDGICGPPTVSYTGWYPKLLYETSPDAWEPTVADVHTDPNSKTVLEEATGSANLAVVAIDKRGDRAVYVGPVSSYYELTSPTRLTDEAWRRRLATEGAPPHPGWTNAWRATPAARRLSR